MSVHELAGVGEGRHEGELAAEDGGGGHLPASSEAVVKTSFPFASNRKSKLLSQQPRAEEGAEKLNAFRTAIYQPALR